MAVYASPRQTVIAGPPEQVDAVIAVVAAQDRLARRIDVDVASHHPIMDPILPELRAALAGFGARDRRRFRDLHRRRSRPAAPAVDADYWAANLRSPVRFSQAITTAGADHTTFIEISPHPLLTHAITDTLAAPITTASATLHRDTDDTVTFHTNLNATHTTHPPRTAAPTRTAPGAARHPLAPHPPLDHATAATPRRGNAPAAGHRRHRSHQRHAGVGKHARPGLSSGSATTASTTRACCPERPMPNWHWPPRQTHSATEATSRG